MQCGHSVIGGVQWDITFTCWWAACSCAYWYPLLVRKMRGKRKEGVFLPELQGSWMESGQTVLRLWTSQFMMAMRIQPAWGPTWTLRTVYWGDSDNGLYQYTSAVSSKFQWSIPSIHDKVHWKALLKSCKMFCSVTWATKQIFNGSTLTLCLVMKGWPYFVKVGKHADYYVWALKTGFM